ncbi:MAG: BamA/TamA family outer membrane protein [Chitinophagales bacterium]|nr:BamA/TamA family outer membrane protein [Chitinophagales bacterium]
MNLLIRIFFLALGCIFGVCAIQPLHAQGIATVVSPAVNLPVDSLLQKDTVQAAPIEPRLRKSWIDKLCYGIPIGKARLLPIPAIGYNPETSFSFGLSAQTLFRFRDSSANLSQAGITVIYTLKRQFVFEPRWRLYLGKDKFRVSGDLVFQRYPDSFFGIGNETKSEDKQRYSAKYFMFKNRFSVRVAKSLFVGFQVRTEYMYDLRSLEEGRFFASDVNRGFSYFATGVGALLEYDTRDNVLYPFKGSNIMFSNYCYTSYLGGNQNHWNFVIDARQFVNPFRSHVLAFQAYAEFNTGSPPFKMLAELGGSRLLRGNFKGRYRDRHFLMAQVEYRFPIWWRFIGVAFVGTGDVADKLEKLSIGDLKLSAGGGLRITLDAKERINLRFDYAFGSNGARGFYFGLTEAF